MKIVAINGSPRKKGNVSKIFDVLIKAAEKNGHTAKIYNVNDLKISGCLACMKCRKLEDTTCVIDDRMKDLYPQIIEADCLLLGSPIYFGHITGPLKTFMDRLYPFMNNDFTVKHLPEKKLITVLASGAPKQTFCEPVSLFLKTWFSEFFKMDLLEQLNIGDLIEVDVISDDHEILSSARRLGESL